MKRNEGYTLIEVIIVIAIMAILSGLSFATIGIIHKARYNTAISNFENQIKSLSVITKATSQAKTQTAREDKGLDVSTVYPMSMLLQKNSDGTYWLVFGYHTKSGFVPKNSDSDDAIQNKDVIEIPDILTIEYTPSVASQTAAGITSGAGYGEGEEPLALFEFNKSDGSVKYGAGKYKFVYSGREVGAISLDSATGNTKTGKAKEAESNPSGEDNSSEDAGSE